MFKLSAHLREIFVEVVRRAILPESCATGLAKLFFRVDKDQLEILGLDLLVGLNILNKFSLCQLFQVTIESFLVSVLDPEPFITFCSLVNLGHLSVKGLKICNFSTFYCSGQVKQPLPGHKLSADIDPITAVNCAGYRGGKSFANLFDSTVDIFFSFCQYLFKKIHLNAGAV